jgi:hypothetical protein
MHLRYAPRRAGGRHGRWRHDGREIHFFPGEPVHLFTLPADAIRYEVDA